MSNHIPVLMNEVINYLSPKDGGVYVDCTFGAGGYSKKILQHNGVTLYSIDCDPEVKEYANKLKQNFDKSNLIFLQGNFSEIKHLLQREGVNQVNGIVVDLGVSSMQLDNANRGFSFNKEARLDMRMSKDGYSAHDFINNAEEKVIADVIYKYGDEHNSRKIAHKICDERIKGSIDSTLHLADIVRSTFTKYRGKIDSATKTFQAIRIFINNELENLKKLLLASEEILMEGGKIIIVSFHSLEDLIVKNFIKEKSTKPVNQSRYSIDSIKLDDFQPTFKNLTRKAIKPSSEEIINNPRSRSARLRAAERL